MSECSDTRDSRVAASLRILENAGKDHFESCSKKGVRELLETFSGNDVCQRTSPRPAHPSNSLVAQLSPNWKVVADPLQWILQRRKGNPRSKNTGWISSSYCTRRDSLLRCIREYCCLPDEGQLRSIREYRGVDPAAVQHIHALPEHHLDWNNTLDDLAHSPDPEQPQ